jgi:S-adenosylmethionine-diacylglycerol 3-amino-3-carboxypropyl transferase
VTSIGDRGTSAENTEVAMTDRPNISDRVQFDRIRYAQCWEDADVLLDALEPAPGDTVLSIASAGDNVLALAGAGAGRVIAVDLNPAQIACLELRIAAYRELSYDEFLRFVGQEPCNDRLSLYRRCDIHLSDGVREFWSRRRSLIERGFAQVGKFEGFLRFFRRYLLPVAEGRRNVDRLFRLTTETERASFYANSWNNLRWRLLCRLFFARHTLGRFGRDPQFTRYADEPVWDSLERRIPAALVRQDPARNPYLQWILKGRYETALPWAWRAENYARIKANVDAVEWRCQSIEDVLSDIPDGTLAGCNLSDIFEYMSDVDYRALLFDICKKTAPGGRLVYWNVVVPRSRPEIFADVLRPLRQLADRLHAADKAFFYRDLVIEEVL